MSRCVPILASRVIQIAASPQPGQWNCGPYTQLFALCEDGSIWWREAGLPGNNICEDSPWNLVQPSVAYGGAEQELSFLRAQEVQLDSLLASVEEHPLMAPPYCHRLNQVRGKIATLMNAQDTEDKAHDG
jgi:hypothetical protein